LACKDVASWPFKMCEASLLSVVCHCALEGAEQCEA
jgi:hypothetical protein